MLFMRCPVCHELLHEQRLACHAEATATLQLRGILIKSKLEVASGNPTQGLHEKVLSSRKQQLKIRSHIEKHRTLAHSA